MSEAPPSTSGPDLVQAVGKWVAILGALLAASQTATSCINGRWQAESDRVKAQQELAMARLTTESTLATSFLNLILNKDTQIPDRALLLGALASIEGHPLRNWAEERRASDQNYLAQLLRAYERQVEAAQIRDESGRRRANLAARIETLTIQIRQSQDNPTELERLQAERIRLYEEQGVVSRTLTVETIRTEETRVISERLITSAGRGLATQSDLPRVALSLPQATPPTQAASAPAGPFAAASTARAETITTFAQTLSVSLLRPLAPSAAGPRLEQHIPPLQRALQEFGVSDRQLVAAIIATVAIETNWFAFLEEADAGADRSAAIASALGNTEPGDGPRFKGRGYVMLTGRANYTRMSERLGLGTALVESPEDAALPEVAARIAVAFFVDRQAAFAAALTAGNLAAARRIVAGGSQGLEQFRTLYEQLVSALPTGRAPPTSAVQPATAQPVVVPAAQYRVFVQFAGSINRDNDVRPQMAALRAAGWNVQGVQGGGARREEAVGTSEIRYGREADRQAAEELARQVQARGISRQPVDAKSNRSITNGDLEVWISR